MRARSFFYASLGVLALVIAFHLGARSATAQSSVAVGAIGCSPGNVEPTVALVMNRVVYRGKMSGTIGAGFQLLPPIPGTSPVVALDASCTGFALLENGDVWAGGGPSWSYVGNVLGGPTPARQESMGAVKARYR